MYLERIYNNFLYKAVNPAICIDEEYVTYGDMLRKINGIRHFIRENLSKEEKGLGLIVYSLPDTYSAIIAFWLEGRYYVPMLPFAPLERNLSVVRESGIKHVFSRSNFKQNLGCEQVYLDDIEDMEMNLSFDINNIKKDDLAYLLFTSGSTGVPKGVPITYNNLDSFVNSMWALGHEIYETDRCLQMFELTFDFSVTSYVLPFYAAACIYIIPEGEIKTSYVLDLLEEYHLTVLNLVPSVMTYLKRFFDELCIPETRLCSFCGEALMDEITKKWQNCIPNSRIINFYGPTEDTVFCTYYDFNVNDIKSHNGVVSIGRDMPYNYSIILNENNNLVADLEEGELCLRGPQLTPGYWDPINNENVFLKWMVIVGIGLVIYVIVI